jgi:hypothetical protein
MKQPSIWPDGAQLDSHWAVRGTCFGEMGIILDAATARRGPICLEKPAARQSDRWLDPLLLLRMPLMRYAKLCELPLFFFLVSSTQRHG